MTARPTTVPAIRQAFLDYFAANEHAVVASHSLLPPADPTLLFVNAGMVQFKDYFTGARTPPYQAACSTQKCLRVSGKHNDLENVGRTKRHHTLFEMLGNFSFGGYFKRDAIRYAWEFLTDRLGLDPARMVATYFGGNERLPADTEARDLWLEIAKLPADRVLPLGEKDNFWAMGDSGPCGPCTEIHYDLEPSRGPVCTLLQDDGRYMEIWNLVFMQYDRQDGKLTPLPAPCVDTGMGLERIASVVQGAESNYGTEVFLDLVRATEALSGLRYGGRFDPEHVVSRDPAIERDVAFRVIADHARATAFLIAEGIYPDSEGRGYVLRRVLRRAIRWGRKLGLKEPCLWQVAAQVADTMGEAFPELRAQKAVIERVTRMEEERFLQTYAVGEELLQAQMDRSDAAGQNKLIPGALVFQLHDTHGFPSDLTALIAAERGFAIDESGFDAAMAEQKARGKASWKAAAGDVDKVVAQLQDEGLTTQFMGYEADTAQGHVTAIVCDGERVQEIAAPAVAWVALDATPLYGEGGGQVGDTGTLAWPGGSGRVTDSKKGAQGLHLHKLGLETGTLRVGEPVTATVDPQHRASTKAHHSATHLLHKALRDVLGAHVKQRGSLVGPGRVRFDFAHFAPMTADELARVEAHVNERVLANRAAGVRQTSMDEAVQQGALAFFGDKYGEVVRVMQLADSVELCGGTHVGRTGDIGLLKIVSEEAVSAGVRRIEAVCHLDALAWAQAQAATINGLSSRLNAPAQQLGDRVAKLQAELKAAQQAVERWKNKALRAQAGGGPADAREVQLGAVKARFQVVDGADAAALRSLADDARNQLGSGLVCFVTGAAGESGLLLVAATKDVAGHIPAGAVLGTVAQAFGGKGGGRPDLAQGSMPIPEDWAAVGDRFFAVVRDKSGAA
jgi:alanyl-tRNA synthetase